MGHVSQIPEDTFSPIKKNDNYDQNWLKRGVGPLKTAFQQLELDEDSKELCTVNTNFGLFKVNRLPFGVASRPSLWQRTMDSILTNLPGVCCFVDDILVAAKTETEHLNRLKAVFKRLQENDVLIKPEKCVFMTKEIS